MTKGVDNNKTTTWYQDIGNFLQDGRVIALTTAIGLGALGYFGYHHNFVLEVGVGGGFILLSATGMILRLRSWINENHPAPCRNSS